MPEIEVLRSNFEERVASIVKGGFPREVAEQLAAEGLGFPDACFFKLYLKDLNEGNLR
jgi:hypothetical protein